MGSLGRPDVAWRPDVACGLQAMTARSNTDQSVSDEGFTGWLDTQVVTKDTQV